MMVTEMGDHGSKSVITVKEQRVDGSSSKFIAPSIFLIVRCNLVTGKPVLGQNKLNSKYYL